MLRHWLANSIGEQTKADLTKINGSSLLVPKDRGESPGEKFYFHYFFLPKKKKRVKILLPSSIFFTLNAPVNQEIWQNLQFACRLWINSILMIDRKSLPVSVPLSPDPSRSFTKIEKSRIFLHPGLSQAQSLFFGFGFTFLVHCMAGVNRQSSENFNIMSTPDVATASRLNESRDDRLTGWLTDQSGLSGLPWTPPCLVRLPLCSWERNRWQRWYDKSIHILSTKRWWRQMLWNRWLNSHMTSRVLACGN